MIWLVICLFGTIVQSIVLYHNYIHYHSRVLYIQTKGKALPKEKYKIVFSMFYTHVMYLQVMYDVAHVCIADLG